MTTAYNPDIGPEAEQIVKSAAKAANEAVLELVKCRAALDGEVFRPNADYAPWVDLSTEAQEARIEVAKEFLGVPAKPGITIQVGDVRFYAQVLNAFVTGLGYATIVQLPKPQFINAVPENGGGPVIEPEPPQEALETAIASASDNGGDKFDALDPVTGPVTEPVPVDPIINLESQLADAGLIPAKEEANGGGSEPSGTDSV